MIASIAAITLGVHLASLHVPRGDFQEFNPGVYVVADTYVAGAYRNSLDRPSVYIGKVFTHGPFSLTVGAISGYQRKEYRAPVCPNGNSGLGANPCYAGSNRGAVGLMLAPSVLLFDHVRITYMPGIHTSSAFHLSLERTI